MCCEGSLGVVSWDHRCTRRSTLCLATRRMLLFIVDLIFSFKAQHIGTLGEVKAIWRHAECIRRSSGLLFFVFSAILFLFAKLNHECTQKAQITHAKIKCALKVSSCDTPLSKNLKLIILASIASSSSTKEIKYPYTKNDSIFTHNVSTI
ncbi:hypothetical protein H5410_027502 [Solanum commersonii]|uniref:Uncharacterized protein n=1 Tax=Solanum commersonii TaxID=4109 RepID=A0A9J5Z013_SOLCO|nr:hypothetical protein H5410_027502 [Solanum commersonii]